MTTDLIGRTFGAYKLVELIGRGGFGEVYAARQPGLRRDAVVKVLDGRSLPSRDAVERFLREARLASSPRRNSWPLARSSPKFTRRPDR